MDILLYVHADNREARPINVGREGVSKQKIELMKLFLSMQHSHNSQVVDYYYYYFSCKVLPKDAD